VVFSTTDVMTIGGKNSLYEMLL